MKKKILLLISTLAAILIITLIASLFVMDTSNAAKIEMMVSQVHEEQTNEKTGKITPKSFEFINEQARLFPTNDSSLAQAFISENLRMAELEKNIDKTGGQLIEQSGFINEIFEVVWKDYNNGEDQIVTYIIAVDTDGNYHELFYLGETNLLAEEHIRFISLPLMHSSYSNVTGGTTRVLMGLVSYIY